MAEETQNEEENKIEENADTASGSEEKDEGKSIKDTAA